MALLDKQDKVVIVCSDTRSMYYGQIMTTSKARWAERVSDYWYYWREATSFEKDLYQNGVNLITDIIKHI